MPGVGRVEATLINAGLPNKVIALKNGTMGWHLAGLKLAHGEKTMAPLPAALASARVPELVSAPLPVSTVLVFDLGVYLAVWGALGGYAVALLNQVFRPLGLQVGLLPRNRELRERLLSANATRD